MSDEKFGFNTDEVQCPHCGYEFSDSWEFGIDGDEHEVECLNEECEKDFIFYVDCITTYRSYYKGK